MAWRTPAANQKAWFVDIAAEVAEARGNSLAENARLFAMLGVANNDTLQTSFASKYEYGLWRPVTAIQRAGEDGNPATDPDPSWTPLHPSTPPYPTYAGNAAAIGATFATVLSTYFGSDNVSFDIQWPQTEGGPRAYGSFSEAAQESANSRIWGGIHFRFDSIAGQFVGTNVADYVLENYFQPVKHGNRPQAMVSGQNPGSNARALEFGELVADSSDLILALPGGNYAPVATPAAIKFGELVADSSDLIVAFQGGNYVPAATPSAIELSAAIDVLFAQDNNSEQPPWFAARRTGLELGWRMAEER
jgi:hypothetical protein